MCKGNYKSIYMVKETMRLSSTFDLFTFHERKTQNFRVALNEGDFIVVEKILKIKYNSSTSVLRSVENMSFSDDSDSSLVYVGRVLPTDEIVWFTNKSLELLEELKEEVIPDGLKVLFL